MTSSLATAQPSPTAGEQRRHRRLILLLAIAQALAGANAGAIFASAGILGHMLGDDPALATLPVSVFVIGMASGTLPAGWLARRYGRRAAFIAGTAAGVLTGLIGALAIGIGSFPLYCVATLAGGWYQSVVLTFRFAVADGVPAESRPRAVSFVMAGGVFSGVIGPQLVSLTMDAVPGFLFLASYLAQAGVALVNMLLLATVDLPAPAKATASGRPLREIAGTWRFAVAVICGVVSYGLMNLVMTSAPLAMHMCGLPITASNWAIQWHIVAMYAPGFITGSLITRFGTIRVIQLGLALLAAAAAVGMAGSAEEYFLIDMILLGLGWNFSFVGASNLVLECHRPEERTRVQSLNDFLVFGMMIIGSFMSGGLLASYGWLAVNIAVLPFVALALVATLMAAFSYRNAQTGQH